MKRVKRTSQVKKCLDTDFGRIDFLLKRSSQRRTLVISIEESAAIIVSAPMNMKQSEIDSFVHHKSKWVVAKKKEALANRQKIERKEYRDGQEFLFLGKKFPIKVNEYEGKRGKIEFVDTHWIVLVPKDLNLDQQQRLIKAKLLDWYKQQASEVLGGRIFHYSRVIGVEPKKIAIRTQKRIWGCCDYNTQSIHLNWQIIFSPMFVIDYIVVHELCHLIVPNHSKKFWKYVEKVMPDWKRCKQWLSVNSLDMALPVV